MTGTGAWNGQTWQELLRDGLAALEIPAEDTVLDGITVRGAATVQDLLSRYMDELVLFNRVFDLVGDDSREGLVVRHILDSLSPWKQLLPLLSAHDEPSLADAGTGAGLPGIPLAILFPETPVFLVERMSRRCSFLENCSALLRTGNITVVNAPIEQVSAGAYPLVVFRAFRPLDKSMYRSLDRMLAPGGHLAAWKGKMEKIREEMDGIAGICGEWHALPAPVPFLDDRERYLVSISRAG